jgi:hypothetical protein
MSKINDTGMLVSGPDGTTVTATVPARQPSGDPDVVTQ